MWRAPATGEYYVKVWGYEQNNGSYTLSVAAVDIADDHPMESRAQRG